jgi:carbonic anhydrase
MDFPERLVAGYQTFLQRRLPTEQDRFRALAEQGQSPKTMVIGCCDSRVSPEVIFDAGPGELFVVRNVANLVPPYSPDGAYHGVSAALEFAVQALKVNDIVVLGHARCGGIQAYAEQAAPLSSGDFIGRWMSLIAPAAASIGAGLEGDDYLTRLEQVSLIRTLDNLMTFPYVRARVEAGEMALHAAYFGVASGALSALDRVSGEFRPVVAKGPE